MGLHKQKGRIRLATDQVVQILVKARYQGSFYVTYS